jgi:hypothetical protein
VWHCAPPPGGSQTHVSVDPSPGFLVEPSKINAKRTGAHGPDDPSTRTQSLDAPVTASNAPVEFTIAARPLA